MANKNNLEEIAIKRYLMYNPCPTEEIFNADGNILPEVKSTPGYQGLIDALFEKGNHCHIYSDAKDIFKYASGYSGGLEFIRKFIKSKNK